MSYSTYWSYPYSVALLNVCLVGECALAPGRPDPLKKGSMSSLRELDEDSTFSGHVIPFLYNAMLRGRSLISCRPLYVGDNSSCLSPSFRNARAGKRLLRPRTRTRPPPAHTAVAERPTLLGMELMSKLEGLIAAGARAHSRHPPVPWWQWWKRRSRRHGGDDGDKECKRQPKRLSLRATSPDTSPRRSSSATRIHIQGMMRMLLSIEPPFTVPYTQLSLTIPKFMCSG